MAYALEKGIIAEDMSLQADKSITRRVFVKIFRASMPSSEFPVINEVSDGKIPDVAMNADGAAQIYDFYRAGILVGSDTFPSLTLKKRKNSLYITQWCRLQAVEI